MASTQFFISAILAILVPSILATDFVVGVDKGWTTGFDYQTWADGKEFHVGDQLGKLALKPLSSLCCQLKCFAFNSEYLIQNCSLSRIVNETSGLWI